jgi:nucleotide-binding universal stress UspA family protein
VDVVAGPHYSYVPSEEEQANWRKQQAHVLEEFVHDARAKREGLSAKAILISGDPRDELVTYAHKENAAIIVIGSRGRGAIKRALLGSVSSYIVTHSTIPVTVVHAREKK